MDITSDLPQDVTPSHPRLSVFTMFRLGLFQMGLGMMSVLFLGVLNRAMIGNLGIPAAVAATVIAMHQFVAPSRVFFGQLSDARPLRGLHRTGYVLLGSILFGLSAFVSVQLMWFLGEEVLFAAEGEWIWTATTLMKTILLGGAFALYGLMLSASSTPFAALLVDISEEDDRPRLVGTVWSMLMVGIVVGAILISVLLGQLTNETPYAELQAGINQVFIIVPLLVFALALLATWGVEKRYSRYQLRSSLVEREDQVTFARALRVLSASRQTGIFFTFLLAMTISLFMQDAVMEPYGALVFGMTYSQTTQLNAFWGMGTLLGIGLTGFLLTPRIGKQKTAQVGCISVAACFGLIILAGWSGSPQLLQVGLLVFGLASGITTTGALSLMLDLTVAETAGTFIGTWGLAQAWARALATVLGGNILSLGQQVFTEEVLAFALVFGTQAAGMILAVTLLSRVNIAEFRFDTQTMIQRVMAADIDG
jgi:BCD family chlorophyll transporter-like MFS transporter